MTETEFQIVKSIGFVFALGVAVGLQRYRPHRPTEGSWRTNVPLWALNALVLGTVCAGCACTVSLWAREGGFGLLNQIPTTAWLAIPLSVIGLDFVSYVWHRANHRLTFLWRFHQAHHSDPGYTVTTALRFHPGELLLALPVRLVFVAVLGVPISGVIVFELVFAFANFWEHGNIELDDDVDRRLAKIVITPALHRRHHGREALLLNSNYGTIFSLWDRWLGTHASNPSSRPIETGLPGLENRVDVMSVLGLPARGVFRGR